LANLAIIIWQIENSQWITRSHTVYLPGVHQIADSEDIDINANQVSDMSNGEISLQALWSTGIGKFNDVLHQQQR